MYSADERINGLTASRPPCAGVVAATSEPRRTLSNAIAPIQDQLRGASPFTASAGTLVPSPPESGTILGLETGCSSERDFAPILLSSFSPCANGGFAAPLSYSELDTQPMAMQGSKVVVQSSNSLNGPLSIPSIAGSTARPPEACLTRCQEDSILHGKSNTAMESSSSRQSHSDQQLPDSQRLSDFSHSTSSRPRNESGQFTVKDKSRSSKKPGRTRGKRHQGDVDDQDDDERPAKQPRSLCGRFAPTRHPSPIKEVDDLDLLS